MIAAAARNEVVPVTRWRVRIRGITGTFERIEARHLAKISGRHDFWLTNLSLVLRRKGLVWRCPTWCHDSGSLNSASISITWPQKATRRRYRNPASLDGS